MQVDDYMTPEDFDWPNGYLIVAYFRQKEILDEERRLKAGSPRMSEAELLAGFGFGELANLPST